MKLKITITLVLGLVSAIMLAACGGSTTTNTATTTAPTSAPAQVKNSAPASDTASYDEPPITGVAECDEYIKRYEACLLKVAKQAPQAEPALKKAFEAQRDGFKKAGANPQAKATLAGTCKQAIETAKTATGMYACEW